MAAATATEHLSPEARRLLQFVRFNEPMGPFGCVLLASVWLAAGRPAFLLMTLASVALNWALVVWARHRLNEDRIEPAVTAISMGMWAISLAIWITLPTAWGLAAIIGLMPIMLAAAYVKRELVLPLMVTCVAVAAAGGIAYPFQPLFDTSLIPQWVMITAIAIFAPGLTASCGLAVWHSISRLLETVAEVRAANLELAESERSLERKVDERTADLTRSQRELALARDQALDANRAKSAFLANMSHELRTPLNAIIGYSEMLQEEATDDGNESYVPDLEKIIGSGRHLLGLINDVLDISKVEAGKVELFAEDFLIADLVAGAAATVGPLVEKNGNTLEIGEPGELEALGSMHTDLTRARQILFNLLSNAAKFTDNGTIRIGVARTSEDDGDWVELSVEDTGIGMSEEQLGKIFESFSQADATTTRDYGGTGLGLAITKRFCELLGGEVRVSSEVGVGTVFSVRVPARLPEKVAEPEADTVPVAHRSSATGQLILVIDDEASARELMERFLSREGFSVRCAASGEEGLRVARAIRPDLITLDVLMPRMDGWSVLSALKADPELQDIPVVVVTMVDDENLGYALGATEYVSKPIDRARLSKVIRQHALHPKTGEARSILVVDDDPTTRQLLRRTVEKDGFEILEAANGRQALELVGESEPSLILLDLMMPEMDGFEFLSKLRAREEWRSIPIVVITAKELSPKERRELDGATEQVLQKGSYDRATLLRDIHRLLEARNGGQATA